MTRVDTASATVRARADRVYTALTDPDALAQWLPPAGMTGRVEHFDARVGGGYRMVLTYADGASGAGKTTDRSDVVDVRFIELVPRTRIVQAVEFQSDAPELSGPMVMTWELTAVHDGTRVEIRAEDVPRGISPEAHAAGLASSMENLAGWLSRSARREA